MTDEEARDATQRIALFLAWMWQFLRLHSLEGFGYPESQAARAARRPLVQPAMMQALREAWQHFETDHELDALQKKIRSTPRDQLIEHGLYGRQLNAKLRMVLVLLSRYEQLWRDVEMNTPAQELVGAWSGAISPPITAEEHRPRKRGFGGVIKSIKDLITGMDVFADSVFDAAGIGKALREIKELFGMSLDEPVE